MAKQIHGPLGGFVGKLGPLIGYRWRGRWCVRTRPQHVHNPRTEAQQRHRSLFRAEVQLAARMRWPIAMALTDEARRRHMTAQNLFVRLNHGLWQPADNPACAAAPDYSRLQLSTGRLEAVCGVRAEVDADGVLRVRFDRCRPEQRAYAYDEVFLYAYSPSAGAGYLFNSVYRRTGRIDVLPPDWLQTDDLQLYLMCRSSDGRWSATVHAAVDGGNTETAVNASPRLLGENGEALLELDGHGTDFLPSGLVGEAYHAVVVAGVDIGGYGDVDVGGIVT